MQVSFKYRNVVIGVPFSVVEEYTLTVLSIKNSPGNSLHISIQKLCVSIGERCHPSTMETNSLYVYGIFHVFHTAYRRAGASINTQYICASVCNSIAVAVREGEEIKD